MKTKTLIFIAMIFVGFASCTKDIIEPKVTVVTPNAAAKFSTDVYPLFANYNCTVCHSDAGAGGLSLTGAASVVRTKLLTSGAVIPNSSATSILFIKFNGVSHNGKTLTSTEVSNMKGWIDSGALDN